MRMFFPHVPLFFLEDRQLDLAVQVCLVLRDRRPPDGAP